MAIFDNLFEAYESSRITGIPFSNFEIKGSEGAASSDQWYWTRGITRQQASSDANKKWLHLQDSDTWNDSGAVNITVAQGYKAEFEIYTENKKYFTDNIENDDDVKITSEGLFGGDEKIKFTLKNGDYLSIDIDEEWSGIFRFRLVIDGVVVNKSDPEKINDETWIRLVEARLINEPPQEQEAQVANVEGDGTIVVVDNQATYTGSNEDTDGDGIPDYLDTDPNDPTVNTLLGGNGSGNGSGGSGSEDEEPEGFTMQGILIMAAVVIGIALLFRFARRSNSTKSGSGGESVGE